MDQKGKRSFALVDSSSASESPSISDSGKPAAALPKKAKLTPTKPSDQKNQGSNTPRFNPTDKIFTSSRMVTVLVGPEKSRFLVHEGVFAHPFAGGFFNKAFTNGFKETSDGVLALPEDQPEAFHTFIKWLYGIVLSMDSATWSLYSILPDMRSLINVYILAQKYMCDDLQDAVMSRMYLWVCAGRKAEEKLDRDMLQLFVDNVQPSHMLTLMVKWIARDTSTGRIEKPKTAFDMVPNDLLRMVMEEMCGWAPKRKGPKHDLGDVCHYHLHKTPGVCHFKYKAQQD